MKVRQIVCGPRREQLPKRDRSEHRMPASPVEVGRLQVQRSQVVEVLRPNAGKLIELLAERLALALALLGQAIEAFERLCLAELEDHPRARHPARPLAVNQMA